MTGHDDAAMEQQIQIEASKHTTEPFYIQKWRDGYGIKAAVVSSIDGLWLWHILPQRQDTVLRQLLIQVQTTPVNKRLDRGPVVP